MNATDNNNKKIHRGLFSVLLTIVMALFSTTQVQAKSLNDVEILPMRERSDLIDNILQQRVETLLPSLMRKANIDMWIIMGREYNEDPILSTFLPATWMGARRRTVLVFTDLGEQGIKAQAMARYNVGTVFTSAWDKEQQPDQMQALVELIKQHNPSRIALNKSKTFALADGLVDSEHDLLLSYLPKEFQQRIVSSEPLAIAWLETRIPAEVEIQQQMVALTKSIIRQAFSNDTIEVGKTTVGDLVWWYRDKVNQLGLQTWFQPAIRLQRQNSQEGVSEDANLIIHSGDLLHVDFGIHYLRLNTDIQQHAYVLKANESDAPNFLKAALKQGNTLQDILTANFKPKRSGNEILSRSREQALLAGLKPMIYSHPIGYHGHGAGTTIGKWDAQHGVPGEGERYLANNSAYSIELNVTVPVKEWQKNVMIMLEENAFYQQGQVNYLAPRQTEFILIKAK